MQVALFALTLMRTVTILFAAQVWSSLSINTSDCQVCTFWTIQRPDVLPAKHFETFVLLIYWHLWKHRNSIVFEGAHPSTRVFWNACKQDASLWRNRLPRADRIVADGWCNILSSM
ncbi:unnamed protein product [Urochloa humidicola]